MLSKELTGMCRQFPLGRERERNIYFTAWPLLIYARNWCSANYTRTRPKHLVLAHFAWWFTKQEKRHMFSLFLPRLLWNATLFEPSTAKAAFLASRAGSARRKLARNSSTTYCQNEEVVPVISPGCSVLGALNAKNKVNDPDDS